MQHLAEDSATSFFIAFPTAGSVHFALIPTVFRYLALTLLSQLSQKGILRHSAHDVLSACRELPRLAFGVLVCFHTNTLNCSFNLSDLSLFLFAFIFNLLCLQLLFCRRGAFLVVETLSWPCYSLANLPETLWFTCSHLGPLDDTEGVLHKMKKKKKQCCCTCAFCLPSRSGALLLFLSLSLCFSSGSKFLLLSQSLLQVG